MTEDTPAPFFSISFPSSIYSFGFYVDQLTCHDGLEKKGRKKLPAFQMAFKSN